MMKIAYPIIASQMCETVMIFTDRLFLSSLGAEQMNAALSGGLTITVFIAFFLGLIGYSTAMIAQSYGSKQYNKIPVIVRQGVIIAFAAALLIITLRPFALIGFGFLKLNAIQLIHQNNYFSILAFGAVVPLLRQVFSSYFSGIGKTGIIMRAAIISSTANIGINYVLIFGNFGFPEMGISGAAIGTIISGILGVGVLIISYLKGVKQMQRWNWRTVIDLPIIKRLWHFGCPNGVEFFLNLLAFTGLVMMFQTAGEVTATAATIMFNWDLVSFFPLIGLEIGVMSMVGKYKGANRIDLAIKSTYAGMKVGMIYCLVTTFFFLFLPGMLVEVFASEATTSSFFEVKKLAVSMIKIASIYVFTEALLLALIGALRGAGDTHFTMYLSVAIHYLMLVIVWLFLHVLEYNPLTAWIAVVCCFLLFTVLFYLRFKQGKWKEIDIS